MFAYYGELIKPHYKNETQKVDEIKNPIIFGMRWLVKQL
jgi:hypothetical protein